MQAEQINVEYFFRLFYNLLFGGGSNGTVDTTAFYAWLAKIWLWVTIVGYGLSIFGFFVVIYATVRLFELRKREEEYYSTLIIPPEAAAETNPRWLHIESLMEAGTESSWREAITEADIMLDNVLKLRGYAGEGVAEKLENVDESVLASLQDAWEAHKVRNQIAHEGSAFPLSEALAKRTMARYEAVFREWGALQG